MIDMVKYIEFCANSNNCSLNILLILDNFNFNLFKIMSFTEEEEEEEEGLFD